MIKSKLLLLFINTDMHSRVEILVHVALVDPTRSNQTNLKSANPREKMLEGLRSSPSPANASQLKKYYRDR